MTPPDGGPPGRTGRHAEETPAGDRAPAHRRTEADAPDRPAGARATGGPPAQPARHDRRPAPGARTGRDPKARRAEGRSTADRPAGTRAERLVGHRAHPHGPEELGTAGRPARDRAAGGRRGPGAPGGWRAPVATRSNALHAGAWWLWAVGLAVAASRTTNPLLLGLLVGVAGYVVAARRTDAPWARSYGAFVKLGLFVIAVRIVFSVALGSPIPGTHLLFTLPEVPMPDWADGIRLGGRVTGEQLLFALYDGAKLATLLICVGAANALANPARLLKSLPGALYEAGVAVVVAMTFAPNMVADVLRLRTARRLRGRSTGGVAAVAQIALPVLEGALERSVAVAASMDARGYGRTARVPPAVRRTTAVLTLGGLLGVCAGSYGLLAAEGAGYAVPLMAAGLVAAAGGLWLGGRRSARSRYRPDRWGARSWLVAGSGAAVALLMIRAASLDPAALHPGVVPPTVPELPLWPALSVLIGLLPAFVAPLPPAAADRAPHTPEHAPAGPEEPSK